MRPFIAFLIILNLGIAAYGLWLRPMSEAEDPSQIAEVNPERIRLLPQVDDSEIVSADPFCVELLETNEETREELNKMFYEMNIDIEMTALKDDVEKNSVLKIYPNLDYSQEQILGMLDQNLSETNFSAVECSPETAD